MIIARNLLEDLELNQPLNGSNNNGSELIAIPVQEGLLFVERRKIIKCRASGSKTICYFIDEQAVKSNKSLKYFEHEFAKYNFFRIDHSQLINVNQISLYLKLNGGSILMNTGEILNVSKRKKRNFLDYLKHQKIM